MPDNSPENPTEKLLLDIDALKSPESIRALGADFEKRLQELRQNLSPKQIDTVLERLKTKSEEIKEQLSDKSRDVLSELKEKLGEMTKIAEIVKGERLKFYDALAKGSPNSGVLGAQKSAFDSIRESIKNITGAVPTALDEMLTSLQNSKAAKFVQRGYYWLMSKLDAKDKLGKSLIPFGSFFAEQARGAREMLQVMDAQAGLQAAVTQQKNNNRLFKINWDQTAWEVRWKSAYQEASKTSMALSVKEFMRTNALAYLAERPIIPGTTEYVELRDIPVPSSGAAKAKGESRESAESSTEENGKDTASSATSAAA